MSKDNNMYPAMPSAPPEMDESKMYPPLTSAPYPPPAYSETMQQHHQQQQQYSSAQQPVPQQVTTTIVIVDSFPTKSIQMKCYYCHEDIRTTVKPQATCMSWLLCSLLCIFGCFCGCCLVPFCTNGTRDILHYCPKCKKYLGVHERARMGRR